MMTRLREWGSALILGAWLSIASVWLVTAVPGGRTPLLWQPMLVVSVLVLTAVQARQVGWVAAVARSFYLAVVMTLAGWLPWLRTILP
ncbi:MAG: hypothetical protein HYZ89_04550, partial [Candidatus Omnitrophica bacterium]|nr:hypothetical protein [Candidatus Omnitrophota bacterium]